MFTKYLSVLNTVLELGLREQTEIPVLASYLTFYLKYKDYNKETFYKLLFSDQTSSIIQRNLGVSSKSFNKSLSQLKEKNMITDNKINSKLLFPIHTDNYRIEISFKEVR